MVLYIIMERSDIGSPSALSWHDTKLFKTQQERICRVLCTLEWHVRGKLASTPSSPAEAGLANKRFTQLMGCTLLFYKPIVGNYIITVFEAGYSSEICPRKAEGLARLLTTFQVVPPPNEKKEMFPQSLRKNQGQERLPAIRTCPGPAERAPPVPDHWATALLTRCRSPLRGGVEPEIQKCFKPLKQVYTFNKLIFKMAGLYPHKTIT